MIKKNHYHWMVNIILVLLLGASFSGCGKSGGNGVGGKVIIKGSGN